MSAKATRDAYGEWLVETGAKNRDIVVVDADLAESTKTIMFAKAYPDRFFDTGAAEQNLVDIAAGLSLGGKRAFASSFAYFLTGRAWDQIRNIVAHDRLNVCLVASHGGLSAAADGASHLALQDVALMRVVPNMRIVVPVDAEETKWALDAALEAGGPFYLRLRRDKEPILPKPYRFALGKIETMMDGHDVTIAAFGPMVDASMKAAELLRVKGIGARVLNVHTVKPFDTATLIEAAKDTGAVVTVEDHSVIGGLGGAVAECLAESHPVPVKRVGADDSLGGSSRSVDPFLKEFGLTPEAISSAAESVIQKRRS